LTGFFLVISLIFYSCNKSHIDYQSLKPEGADTLYANLGDIRIAYMVVGEGYPLILCMGYSGTMDLWAPDVVENLAQQYQVILYDYRGMGLSTILTDTSTFSMKLFTEDTRRLMDFLGIPKAHILGWSMGTYVAQLLTLDHPDRIDKVILYGADCGDSITIQPADSVETILNNPDASLEELLSVLFPSEWLQSHPDWWNYFPIPQEPKYPEIIARQWQAIQSWFAPGGGTANRLKELKHQTLLITGNQDICTPSKNSLIMIDSISGASLIQIPGGGHGVMYQYPAKVTTHTLTFLANKSK